MGGNSKVVGFSSGVVASKFSKLYITSVGYLQANSQVEVTNRILVQGLKTKLEATRGNWMEELPRVLWAYRTTVKPSMGEIPFSMVYGAEAIIPAEVLIESARVHA